MAIYYYDKAIEDVRKLTEYETQVWYGRQKDTLFGVYNRRLLLEKIVKSDKINIYLLDFAGKINSGTLFRNEMEDAGVNFARQGSIDEQKMLKSQLHQKQIDLMSLMEQINEQTASMQKLAKLNKRMKNKTYKLPDPYYAKLRGYAQGLGNEAKGAYPEDILAPYAMSGANKMKGKVLSTLTAAVAFLEALLKAIKSDKCADYKMAFIPILEIISSSYGKQCITSIGNDIYKLFTRRIIGKL
jgi:hypothetical protein